MTKTLALGIGVLALATMTKLVQRYQNEFGLAIVKELQRNQERSRRGSTPLNPSLANGVQDAKNYAFGAANSAQANAQYNASVDAQYRADAAYNTSVQHTNNVHAAANSYTNSMVGSHGVPYAAEMMWIGTNPVPGGWVDTGRTVQLDGANSRRVIRKVV